MRLRVLNVSVGEERGRQKRRTDRQIEAETERKEGGKKEKGGEDGF